MANYAYIRVSTAKQNPKAQKFGVLEYCNKKKLHDVIISVDVCTGGVAPSKRKLGAVIDQMQAGDHLIVTEVSRLGRSLRDVIMVLEQVKELGATVHVIKQNLILSEQGNALGKLVVAMYSIFAEMERELIQQRVIEGIASAKARGVKFGRPAGWCPRLKLDGEQDKIIELLPLKLTNAKMARMFDVSPTTMRKWLKRKVDTSDNFIENPPNE